LWDFRSVIRFRFFDFGIVASLFIFFQHDTHGRERHPMQKPAILC